MKFHVWWYQPPKGSVCADNQVSKASYVRNYLLSLLLCAIAVNCPIKAIAGGGFTADSVTIPASLKYILDQRVGATNNGLYSFDLEAMNDTVQSNLPGAILGLTVGANQWTIVLNEFEIRSDEFALGNVPTFKGYLQGDTSKRVRMFLSTLLFRGTIYDGSDMHRIVSIQEYGKEFSNLDGVYVHTILEEEPYQLEPSQEDCENPIIEFGIDADYAFYQAQGSDLDLATDRILSAMNEAHEIYEDNFGLDIRVVGPFVRTAPGDVLVLPIGNIQELLTNVWEFQRPCLNVDVAFLFSGKDFNMPVREAFRSVIPLRSAGRSKTTMSQSYRQVALVLKASVAMAILTY